MKSSVLSFLSLLCHVATAINPRNQLKRSVGPSLDARQSCPSGYKGCGEYCILNSYTCCPDRQGGCPADEYCSLGDNGEYGCCDDGEVCTGDGGASITGTFTSTSTRTRTTSIASANNNDDDNLSWRTLTVTYDDGDRQRLSYAVYDGSGIVTESDDLAWTTWTLTQDNGNIITRTVASEIPDPLPFTITYIDRTTTQDFALYEGGYVSNSDSYEWSTSTITFSTGDTTVTTATFALLEEAQSTTSATSRSRSTASESTGETSTSPATVTVTGASSSNPATVTVTQPSGGSSASGAGAVIDDVKLFAYSAAGAGFLALVALLL